MKLLLFALVILFMSCSPFGLNPMGYEVLHEDLDTAWQKVASMKYIPEEKDYWKSPREFFRDGGGDCEDFAIALMYLLGLESEFVGIDDGTGYRHAIVEYRGEYLEPIVYPYRYAPETIVIVARAGYYPMMEYATNNGWKRL